MPEQLLARIIQASSRPCELVLDPFCGSGTTVCVAKKLGRHWLGFELSEDYVRFIAQRLATANLGDPIDGPEDPIRSAPNTARGRRRKKAWNEETEKIVVDAYKQVGYPADYILCDRELNEQYVSACLKNGIGGNAYLWNRYLLGLQKASKLPRSRNRPPAPCSERIAQVGFASEVAWRLLAIDYQKTLDDILCSPTFAAEFDRLAAEFGPADTPTSSLEYRCAALSIRKRSHLARETATRKFGQWTTKRKPLPRVALHGSLTHLAQLEQPGVFVLTAGDLGLYAGESGNMRVQIDRIMCNPNWESLEPDCVKFVTSESDLTVLYALKSALAIRESPLLNCRLLSHDSELPQNGSGSKLAESIAESATCTDQAPRTHQDKRTNRDNRARRDARIQRNLFGS
jgi:site-specific DNA-methyltransferase (adenine-specific)